MMAPPQRIWELVADVRNTGRFSPETFDAQWLDGVTEPTIGARFRGHVKRNEIGPIYWTTCRVTACEPGREFGFEIAVPTILRATAFLGVLRKRRNLRDMRTTLERIRDVVEA